MFMFCGECGTQNPDTNQFCKNCGNPLKKNAATAPLSPSAPIATPQAPPSYYVPPPEAPLVAGTPVVAKQPWSKGLLLPGSCIPISVGYLPFFLVELS
jgi:hypothetical protein